MEKSKFINAKIAELKVRSLKFKRKCLSQKAEKKKIERLSRSEAATDQEEKKREVEVATLLSKDTKNMQTL